MATEPLLPDPSLAAREQAARIDRILADVEQKLATVVEIKQETRYAPWQVFGTLLGAATAFFAAGIAFAKLFIS